VAEIVIFDTDILIDYLLGREQAREFLFSFEKSERFLTSISAMEIYRGARNKREFDILKKFFEGNFEDLIAY
jgi:predicted nucleic acid-binding protein